MEDLLKRAILITIRNGCGSTSLLQRKLVLGYNKAEKLMDEMEQLGVVGSRGNNIKPRKLLIKSIDELVTL